MEKGFDGFLTLTALLLETEVILGLDLSVLA